MLRALTALALAVLCFTAWPGQALAQRVLLARPPATDTTLSEAFNRLRAELALQDFEVEVPPWERMPPTSVITPPAMANNGVHTGFVIGATRISPGSSRWNSSGPWIT